MNFNYYMKQQKKRESRRQWAREFLGGKCVSCHTTKLLHFDHIDPTTKLFDISQGLTNSIDILKSELEKCQLLCNSCHGYKTAKDRWPKKRIKITLHGTLSKYMNAGCRCDDCKAANTAYYRQYREAISG